MGTSSAWEGTSIGNPKANIMLNGEGYDAIASTIRQTNKQKKAGGRGEIKGIWTGREEIKPLHL